MFFDLVDPPAGPRPVRVTFRRSPPPVDTAPALPDLGLGKLFSAAQGAGGPVLGVNVLATSFWDGIRCRGVESWNMWPAQSDGAEKQSTSTLETSKRSHVLYLPVIVYIIHSNGMEHVGKGSLI